MRGIELCCHRTPMYHYWPMHSISCIWDPHRSDSCMSMYRILGKPRICKWCFDIPRLRRSIRNDIVLGHSIRFWWSFFRLSNIEMCVGWCRWGSSVFRRTGCGWGRGVLGSLGPGKRGGCQIENLRMRKWGLGCCQFGGLLGWFRSLYFKRWWFKDMRIE